MTSRIEYLLKLGNSSKKTKGYINIYNIDLYKHYIDKDYWANRLLKSVIRVILP